MSFSCLIDACVHYQNCECSKVSQYSELYLYELQLIIYLTESSVLFWKMKYSRFWIVLDLDNILSCKYAPHYKGYGRGALKSYQYSLLNYIIIIKRKPIYCNINPLCLTKIRALRPISVRSDQSSCGLWPWNLLAFTIFSLI